MITFEYFSEYCDTFALFDKMNFVTGFHKCCGKVPLLEISILESSKTDIGMRAIFEMIERFIAHPLFS